MTATTRLVNHFLVAMPSMDDARFAGALIYLFDHNRYGAAGFVVNKPSKTSVSTILKRMDLRTDRADLQQTFAFDGGPVHTERGFVLHMPTQAYDHEVEPARTDTQDKRTVVRPSDDDFYAATVAVRGGIEITTSRDVMEAVAEGVGPPKLVLCCGYASWSMLQLEAEIANNDWLAVPADSAAVERLIFDTPVAARYNAALALLGLERWMLSSGAKVVI